MKHVSTMFAAVAVLALGAGVAVSPSAAADLVPPQVQICRTVPDANARLACYDRAVDISRVQPIPGVAPSRALPTAPAPQAAVPYAAPSAAVPQAAVPQAAPAAPRVAPAPAAASPYVVPYQQRQAAPPTANAPATYSQQPPTVPPASTARVDADGNITATVNDVKWDRFGLANVTLDNGQVWRQVGSTPVRYNIPVGREVEVRKGMFGAYSMVVSSTISFRVALVD